MTISFNLRALTVAPEDIVHFSYRALIAHKGRTVLMLLAMSVAVMAVVLLTALGEGVRRYVVDEFASLGTNLLFVFPGRSETTGGPPPMLAATPRPLTIDDALALTRSRYIDRVAPVVIGNAPVSVGGLARDVNVLGSTHDLYTVRDLRMEQGRFLSVDDPAHASGECVLGDELKAELFGGRNALGARVRVGDHRCRVIGVLAPKGESISLDLSDIVIMPVASTLQLFDREGLFRIIVKARDQREVPLAKDEAIDILRERHDGDDDVTVVTQDAVLGAFDNVLRTLTLGVAGVAGISLVVAGILIMNVMLVAVSQRTAEIGLLKALGSPRRQILALFITEASLLAGLGAAIGLALAQTATVLLAELLPALPITIPWWAVVIGVIVALLTGILFGYLPARRAATLDPVDALHGY